MDLGNIKPIARVIDIKHPATGEETGLRITLAPQTDPTVEAVRRRITNARLGKRQTKIKAEDIEQDAIELLAATITGVEWGGDSSWKGEKPALTPALARELMQVEWLRKQVDDEAGDSAAFFKPAPNA